MLDRLTFVVSTRQSLSVSSAPGSTARSIPISPGVRRRSIRALYDRFMKKLGMKPGDQVCLLDAPPEAVQLLHAGRRPAWIFLICWGRCGMT